MADRTRIQWADATWNPMTGCTPVSEACEHCYAERMNRRFHTWENCDVGEGCVATSCSQCKRHFIPQFHPNRLDKPLHWRKPRRIFVCSMSDLFHEAFTDEQIDQVLGVMVAAPQHTYMVLTKRPDRARKYLGLPIGGVTRQDFAVAAAAHQLNRSRMTWPGWPLSNLWLGVTAENQQLADERIPILLDTPAAVRFVSLEPLLGAVDVRPWLRHWCANCGTYHSSITCWQQDPPRAAASWLDWVIVGGETGPGARPMQPEWALDVYRQCRAAGVPFFWKQWGAWAEHHLIRPDGWHDMVQTREVPEVTT